MGVHDYTCFVQRNGQDLRPLEFCDDDEKDNLLDPVSDGGNGGNVGGSTAILVKVPAVFTVQDILSWKLTRFAEFPAVGVSYDWGDWEFSPEVAPGYGKVWEHDETWIDTAIWESSAFPDTRLVNFEPEAYNAFVLGRVRPNTISGIYYRTVFENRETPIPADKTLAFDAIVHGGAPSELELPAFYTDLMKRFAALPVFNGRHKYILRERPVEIPSARLIELLEQATPAGNVVKLVNRKHFDHLNIRKESESGTSLVIQCFFEPLPDSSYYSTKVYRPCNDCIHCGEAFREDNSWFCSEHLGDNVDAYKLVAEKRVLTAALDVAEKLITVIRTTTVPDKLYLEVTEKNVLHRLELHLQSN